MLELLFDGKHDVSLEEVLERMNYFINTAQKGMEVYEKNKKESLDIAKKLRNELENEYKNNSLKRIRSIYSDNIYFNCYSPAVHESVAAITGRLSYNNVYSFLYDVDYYMRYHLPSSK